MENINKLKEKWKPVPDFPDYMVSDFGRVKSLKHILEPKRLRHFFQMYLRIGFSKVTNI